MMPLVALALRPAIVLAAGLLIRASLMKRSAALRHRVLAATLFASAAVLPLGSLLPAYTVSLPAPAAVPVRATAPPPPAEAVLVTAADAPAPPGSGISWLFTVWAGGALVALGSLAAGLWRVARMAARAKVVDDTRWRQVGDEVARRYGLTRRVRICRVESGGLLATWGILRPQVLVPRHAGQWTAERVRVVLCHELAHVRRHDWGVQLGAEMVRALLWFNPLAWAACTRLRRESEQACDDEVIGMGVGAREYAEHLIDLARQCRTGSTWASAVPMAHPSTLERRIAAMLNPRVDRRAPSRRVMGLLAVGVLLVTLPAAVLRARQAGPAPLTGTIYDVSGGVLPGVQVTLVDAKDVSVAAASSADGRFEFPAVAPGKYVLSFALPGFKVLRHEFELRDAADWDRAFTLQVGDLRETVTVRASRAGGTPAIQPAPGQPVRVGGNVRPPKKLKDVKPVYPPAMRDAGLTGTVSIEAIIGRDGTVTSVRVLSAQVHPDFAIAAADAVRRWQFTPTLLNGVAVEVVMTVSVRFDLEG